MGKTMTIFETETGKRVRRELAPFRREKATERAEVYLLSAWFASGSTKIEFLLLGGGSKRSIQGPLGRGASEAIPGVVFTRDLSSYTNRNQEPEKKNLGVPESVNV